MSHFSSAVSGNKASTGDQNDAGTKTFSRTTKEINILILGETGVGKSTWINSIANILTYETLEEAERKKFCRKIPSKFFLSDENYEQIEVTTGVDRNESHIDGQSCTQEAKIYPFLFGSMTVRLIDTPGIGDTRGMEYDQLNFQNILATLSHFKELHGICIFLKPNQSRLNVHFQFCFQELLRHLHRDASRNIVFCFTHTRAYSFKPGDTLLPLKTYLETVKGVKIPISKETLYCFDNEFYLFLAAKKRTPPVELKEEFRINSTLSWNKSREETIRMLDHIIELQPHSIESTLKLNHTRQLVIQLTRPLAEISKNIHTNQDRLKKEKKDIEEMKENIDMLRSKLKTKITKIEQKSLEFPKTVCGHNDCVELVNIGNSTSTLYKQVCHDMCRGGNRISTMFAGINWRGCSQINWLGKCKKCGHIPEMHLHIKYDSVQVEEEIEDEAVKRSINAGLTGKEMKMKMIKWKEQKIAELESDLREIEEASVKFAYFLKCNAIAPFNDSMEEYLKQMIYEKKNEVSKGGNEEILNLLKASLESYKTQKALLEEKMGQVKGHAPDVEEIEPLIEKLKKLKNGGETLKEAIGFVQLAERKMRAEVMMQPTEVNNVFLENVAMVWGKGKLLWNYMNHHI